MQENIHCVYMHINKFNGKKYIGQAKGDPRKRWGAGYKGCTIFYNAIKKYGWNNFQHIVLVDGLTINEANLYEQFFIALYRTTDRNFGYNLQSGGKNCSLADETKQKISLARMGRFTGRDNPNYGNHRSGKEHPNFGKHYNVGKNNYFYGKTHTPETIEYLRQINKGKKHSAETKEKMKKYQKGKQVGVLHSNIKPVLQFEKNGVFVKEWEYINQARDCLGIDPSTIVRCCKGKQKTAGGYIWKYKNEA
jgi:group I intron endonuclease